MSVTPPRIVRAENDLLFDEDGKEYIDLFSAHGTTWLGHVCPEIAAAVARQLQCVWITGGLPSTAGDEARAAVDRFFPASHGLCALYSTGMEAVEFALRLARTVTGASAVIGFERSMHGKSLAAASLAWDNPHWPRLPGFHRLPFVPRASEPEIVARLEALLRSQRFSAVFVEPLQASAGGHHASVPFYRELHRLTRANGALLIFDEILTGFYRTGTPFFFSELGFTPDVVLIGKAMGNGFPVSGVVANRQWTVQREMLPGSTYAGNPLAAAAVVATLRQLEHRDIAQRVARIEQVITESLAPLTEVGVTPRGKGALWVIELPDALAAEPILVNIFRQGVCVGHAGSLLRIMPAATIEPSRLAQGCRILCDCVRTGGAVPG